MTGESPLAALGITPLEERVYRQLIRTPGTTADRLARAVDEGAAEVRAALRDLESYGMVSRAPGSASRFMPSPPDVAVELLILRRQQELEEARLAAAQLTEEFRTTATRTSPAELVEIITGREPIVQRFLQLQVSAREELLGFDTPPYLGTVGPHATELEVLARGVRYRIIYTSAALDHPGQIDALRVLAEAGEEARIVPELPMKLAIADRRLALLPLSMNTPDAQQGAMLVHESSLLDALAALFEAMWRQGRPVRAGEDAVANVPELSAEDQDLLLLMAGGLKDDAIARQLGIGRRTVQRRISRLADAVGTDSRLALVLEVARRGWV